MLKIDETRLAEPDDRAFPPGSQPGRDAEHRQDKPAEGIVHFAIGAAPHGSAATMQTVKRGESCLGASHHRVGVHPVESRVRGLNAGQAIVPISSANERLV